MSKKDHPAGIEAYYQRKRAEAAQIRAQLAALQLQGKPDPEEIVAFFIEEKQALDFVSIVNGWAVPPA